MFNLINNINSSFDKFYLYIKALKISNIFCTLILSGFLTGLLLGFISFVERTFTYGWSLSLINKLKACAFSVSLLGLSGTIVAFVEFILLIISIYLFLGLISLTQKDNKVYPYKIIILYSVIFAAISDYILIKVFIESSDNFIGEFVMKGLVIVVIMNIIFYLSVMIITFILYNYAKKLLNKYNLLKNSYVKYWLVSALLIWVAVVLVYYNSPIFSNYGMLCFWAKDVFFINFNLVFTKVLMFYARHIVVFNVICFLVLTVIYTLINYIAIFVINKAYNKRGLLVCLYAIGLILLVFLYILSQNLFTNQLLIFLKMSLAILPLVAITFLLFQLIVLVAYKYIVSSYKLNLCDRKTVFYIVIPYIVIFIIGVIGFNSSDAVKTLIYRHNTFEKVALRWPILLNLKPVLPLIPSKVQSINKDNEINLKQNNLITRPNIIVITVDALRYDATKELISDKSTTLGSFADKSVYFLNSYANAPFTIASTCSMNSSKLLVARSDIDYITFAQILSANGYETYSTNIFDTHEYDFITLNGKQYPSLFAKGFKVIDKPKDRDFKVQKDNIISAGFIKFLRHYDNKKPLFAWIHYSELHLIPARIIFKNLLTGEVFINTYRKVLKAKDADFKDLFIILKQLDLYDNSIIIITSDHGESAKEHGDLFHIFSLYQENIRIPLFIKFPKQKYSQEINYTVSLVDLYPTILDYIGYDIKKLHIDGRSLLPLINKQPLSKEPVYSSITMYKNPTFAYGLYGNEDKYQKSILEVSIVDENSEWKFINNLFYGFKELYNLKSDPKEQNNLIDLYPQKATQMLQKIHNTLFFKK